MGSRKRLLSAKEEAEHPAKRTCDKQREDAEVPESEERSPGAGAPRLRAAGDSEGFVSGEFAAPRYLSGRVCRGAAA